MPVGEEVKKQEFSAVSPWDMLVWKLDSLEKGFQREIEILHREIGGVKEEIAGLRAELRGVKGEIAELRAELRGVREEITELRTGLHGVKEEAAGLRAGLQATKQEIAELRAELRDEIRGGRRSFTVLEVTVVLGFLAVIATFLVAKLL
ncbi:hypothetical protein [Ammonifex thiophilus]|uniref:DUF1640 domain-containing protein n=1 Tax=Ammonifex thiophilus TaxID=444093 RepID=A0A3D8P434_9THEO|nr:hypothetical protein [Ammonifex thiophilus]RDV83912.1 hypothetical protein DXX99_03495 [Ammonifex thiophilus]